MGRSRRLAALVAVGSMALVGAACGGDSETTDPVVTNDLGIPEASGEDGDAYEPRGTSVGDGNGGAPSIDSELLATATAAGCKVQAFAGDKAGQASAREHVEGDPGYTVSLPPVSGPHNGTWADWGFYDLPVPYKFLVHNLEHGGVIVHYGSELARADVKVLGELWAKRSAYTIFTPDTSATFPAKGVVVGAWQRWMVCKPFAAAQIPAIDKFITAYRGKGPEEVGSVDSGGSAPGLPKPAVFDAKTN